MAYEMKDNSGSIFKNTKKENDKQPSMTGSALIDGVDYWVSGWTKESEKSGKWISMSFKKKDAVHGEGRVKAQAALKQDDFTNDEIPF